MYRWENECKFYQSTSGIGSTCGDKLELVGGIYDSTNELIFVGGVESNKWLDDGKSLSRNFKQGYRVYDSNGIACSQTTNGGGTWQLYRSIYSILTKL